MKKQGRGSPFTPGTGFAPPLLAGRDAETRVLADVLDGLRAPRAKESARPVRICGPRGVGKTVLLNWIRRRAGKESVRAVSWSRLKGSDCPGESLEDLMCNLAGPEERIAATIGRLGVTLLEADGRVVPAAQAERGYGKIMPEVLAEEPVLLVMDEVHHYDPGSLGKLLRKNCELMEAGLPLAMVLAGTPRLDRHLHKADPGFLDRSEGLYVNLLSDDAARDAMRVPFEEEGAVVAPAALEVMATMADNYPYFTQLVGEAVWDAMEEAGRRDVDAEIVAT
ncbi:MAG: ATP-binding protein, partial [Betaproteobacteria bacterium AqS2]|nr:ATP-binding protein [Betaproteobacteria bacterium AqS2]